MINYKKKIGNILLIISGLFLLFLGFKYIKEYYSTKEVIKYVKTIEKHVDTLYLERKVIEEKIVYKEKYREKLKEQEKLIKYDSICNEIVDNLKKQLDNCDSVVVFKDIIITKTDSIILYKDKIIEVLEPPKKPKIITIGPQVGYNPFTNKVTFGIGATINVASF